MTQTVWETGGYGLGGVEGVYVFYNGSVYNIGDPWDPPILLNWDIVVDDEYTIFIGNDGSVVKIPLGTILNIITVSNPDLHDHEVWAYTTYNGIDGWIFWYDYSIAGIDGAKQMIIGRLGENINNVDQSIYDFLYSETPTEEETDMEVTDPSLEYISGEHDMESSEENSLEKSEDENIIVSGEMIENNEKDTQSIPTVSPTQIILLCILCAVVICLTAVVIIILINKKKNK